MRRGRPLFAPPPSNISIDAFPAGRRRAAALSSFHGQSSPRPTFGPSIAAADRDRKRRRAAARVSAAVRLDASPPLPRGARDSGHRERRTWAVHAHGANAGRRLGDRRGATDRRQACTPAPRERRRYVRFAPSLGDRAARVRSRRRPDDNRARVRARPASRAADRAAAGIARSGRVGPARVRAAGDRRPAGELRGRRHADPPPRGARRAADREAGRGSHPSIPERDRDPRGRPDRSRAHRRADSCDPVARAGDRGWRGRLQRIPRRGGRCADAHSRDRSVDGAVRRATRPGRGGRVSSVRSRDPAHGFGRR